MVRLPPALPARQEFLGLQPVREPAEPRFIKSARVLDHRLLCGSANGGFSAGGSGILLESRRAAKQFASRTGSGAAHAELRSYFASAIEGAFPLGLFAESR